MLDSKSLVRSAENEIVKSSWICLLLTCQSVLECEDTWIPLAAFRHGCGQWSTERACLVYRRTDELFTKRHTVSGGQVTTPFKEWANRDQSLSCLSSYLFDVRRPGQPCVKGSPKMRCSDLHLLSPKLDWHGLLDACCSPCGAFWAADSCALVP
jgi:hypothetical protein